MAEDVELRREDTGVSSLVKHADNTLILIALGIISGHITIISGSGQQFESILWIVDIMAYVSGVFVVGKSITIFIKQFHYSQILRYIDKIILPGLFVVTLLFGILLASPRFISMPPYISDILSTVELTGIIGQLARFETYVALVAIISIALGSKYTLWTAEKMADLETRTPDVRISFTSGPRGTSFPLTLKNPQDEDIQPEEIQIEVESSKGVDVDIPRAKQLSSELWQPTLPVPQNQRLEIPIRIRRSEGTESISKGTVTIKTSYRGETKQKQVVKLEG